MKCNCNNSNNGGSVDDIKIKHVYGNVLRLAIPLTKRIVTVENEEVIYTDSDFIPSSEYPVTVEFSKGNIKISHQAIMHDGNVAYIEDDGTIPVGVYDITVLCKDDDGKPYRFKKKSVVDVSNYTIDADIEQPVEFESIVWYLDAAIYMALKGEDGVGIEDIITQSSSEIGGLNVITIVLTNGETKTFTILNGSGTVDNHFDENSPYPIANNVVTTKINAIDDYLSNLFGQVVYDSNSKNIFFYNKDRTKILATLDARPFIKDGMVSNAYISNNTLVITFNTDAGREAIAIPLSSVFNPNNYYNKSQTDNRISQALQDIVSNTVSANQLIGNKIIIGNAQISLRESNGNYMIEFGLITEGQQSVKTITLPFVQYRDSIAMHSDLDTLFSLVFGQVDYDSTNHRINFYAKNDESKTTPLGYIDSTPFEGGGSGGGDGTVTAIKMNNGTPIEPDSNGVVDLGTVITQHQDLSDFATTDDVDNAIAALVSSAPQTLDTLKELADALGDDPNFATTMATALGNKVDKVNGKGLSTNDYTNEEKTKLGNLPTSDQLLDAFDDIDDAMSGKQDELTFDETPTENSNNPVTSGGVKSYVDSKPTITGVSSSEDGTFTISLSNGDSYIIDLNHTHPQYVEKVTGKGLSTNDYTNAEKTKLGDLPTSAQLIQAFSDLQGDIPTKTSDLTNDSGFISTETDPTVPAWAKTPTKPTYTAQEVGALPANTSIPSKTSDLTNDSGFIDKAMYYGLCESAASAMPKVCTVETFPTTTTNGVTHAADGTIIAVKFINSDTNTTEAPELNVNGIGAKAIMYNNAIVTSTAKNTTIAGYAKQIAFYRYDPEMDEGNGGWEFLAKSVDSNSTYSQASLGQGYAVQSNSAAATAITASISSYALAAGGIVSIKFAYDVPANATLNISSKGAKAIYNRGAAIAAGVIKAGDTATFIYSTYYHLISIDRDENVTVDSQITQNGTNPVQGGAIYSALEGKVKCISYDDENELLSDTSQPHGTIGYDYEDGWFYIYDSDGGWYKICYYSDLTDRLIDLVPRTRKVNNKALTSDITLNASDVGAMAEATVVEVSTAGAVSQALSPNTFYKFTGALTSLTLTLTAGTGLVVYAGKFTTGSGWGSNGLSIPATVTEATGNDEIAASKTYEFSILDNVIVIKEV